MKHFSVMRDEVLKYLNLSEDSVVVDATLGYAGHSQEILKRIKKGFLYAFDNDLEAINASENTLSQIGNNFKIFHSNFVQMDSLLNDVKQIDAILFDLGVSSPQLDDEHRGFSFMRDEILDMRMNQASGISAHDVVNTYSEEELSKIFFRYGEEKNSKLIAKKIISVRNEKEIKRTQELVEIIKSACGANYFFKKHPERNIFQAIRIEVNKELESIETVLPKAIEMLAPGGRIVVLTFHSLEDRIVKHIFKEMSEVDEMVKGLPVIPVKYQPKIKLITKKPIVASEKELMLNSRSKSAKLRIIEKV